MTDPDFSRLGGEPEPLTAMFARLREELIAAEPEVPHAHGMLASHKVPYGKFPRQWDTKGRLWLWVNRGELEDMTVERIKDEIDLDLTDSSLLAYHGLPVYNV